MEWLKRFLKPNQSNFLQLLIQQGEFTIAGVEALQAYLKKPVDKRSIQARQVEKDADEIFRILVHELEDTFITPSTGKIFSRWHAHSIISSIIFTTRLKRCEFLSLSHLKS